MKLNKMFALLMGAAVMFACNNTPTPEPKPEEPTPEPKPEEPTPEPEQKPEQKPESDNKDPGDHFDLILWISVMVASASAVAILIILRKKSKEE